AIEIDGMSHNHKEAFLKDEVRQKTLESLGVIFLRFTEAEMKHDMDNTVRTIESKIIDIIKEHKISKLPKAFDLRLLD
ncbi:MAG TPA: DUF559 domain-containing protein, partial [Mucilaginibacter sp.]